LKKKKKPQKIFFKKFFFPKKKKPKWGEKSLKIYFKKKVLWGAQKGFFNKIWVWGPKILLKGGFSKQTSRGKKEMVF
jgi:hypothetical protein